MTDWDRLSAPDQIRLREGTDSLRRTFRARMVQDRIRALRDINGENLMFPSLFALMPLIKELRLIGELNERNAVSLRLCAKKSGDFALESALSRLLHGAEQAEHNAFKWMFETGADWSCPEPDRNLYDAVMDGAAVTLIKRFADKSALPKLAMLLFKRNRNDLYMHDLVWCYYQAYDPDAMHFIAGYLFSKEKSDVRLACKMLHLNEPDESDASKEQLFRDYFAWLSENHRYLYITGESFQYSSEPEPLRVDLDAKYLGSGIPPRRKRAPVFSPEEQRRLEQFHAAPAEDQVALAAFSHRIQGQDPEGWQQWKQVDIASQIYVARQEMGGEQAV